jgi:hypothetical protein
MAVSLGKRKRPQPKTLEQSEMEEEAQNQQALQDIFRKAFEAKFKPLPVVEQKPSAEDQDLESSDESDEDEDDEWDGFSGDERPTVAVVEHIETSRQSQEGLDKRELRAFLVRRDPTTAF